VRSCSRAWDRDGTRAGYDLELLRALVTPSKSTVIASGGVGTLEHLREGLAEGGADAALAASIFMMGLFSVGKPSVIWPSGRTGSEEVEAERYPV